MLASEPGDVTFRAGSLAPSIEWAPFDLSTHGSSYHVTIPGIGEVASGYWSSGEIIAWNPSGLPVGQYSVLLELDDGLGGVLEDEVNVKSNDQVAFLNRPWDFSYHVGEMDYIVEWTVSDLLGFNPIYDLFIRGFEGEGGLGNPFITGGAWTSGSSSVIAVNLGGMPAGLYLASLVVSDGLGSQAMDQVVFCVTPEGMNALDWLESQLVEAGSGMTCGTSSGPVSVDVTFDTAEDTQVAIGIWNTPPQPEGPDFATDGVYFTVDAEREVAVTFPIYVDVTLPGGFPAGMTESDVAAWLRFFYYDEVSETWVDTGFPIVDIDLAAGTATFEVWHLSAFALGFANGLPPKIDGPGTFGYEFNSSPPQLVTWRLADLTVGTNPTYTVFLDGDIIAQGTWTFGTLVTVDVAGLSLGSYNLDIIAFDDLGGSTSDQLPMEVYNVAPVLDRPADVVYEVGTLGHYITWTPFDISVGIPSYFVTIDGTQTITGTWTSGAGILVPVDGLWTGSHTVEMTVVDGFGGATTSHVIVVAANVAPVVAAPDTATYEEGDPRPMVEWTVTDPSVFVGTYVVYCDGDVVTSGQWVSGVPFTTSASGLVAGPHTLTCVVQDGYGGTGAASVDVVVMSDDDVTPPVILAVESPAVQDTASFIPVKVFAFDGISGIDEVIVQYMGYAFRATNAGDYYFVNLPNSRLVGTTTAIVTVWDNDQDHPNDALSTVQSFPVTILNTVPQVIASYTNATLSGEFPASYTFAGLDTIPTDTNWTAGVQGYHGQPVPGVVDDYAYILPEHAGHSNVACLYKNSSVSQVIAACFAGHEIPSGSIELWVAVEGDAYFMAALSAFSGSGSGPWIVIAQGQLAFLSASGELTMLGAFTPSWHWMRIDFAGAGTSFGGLTENQIAITLDDAYLGALDVGAPYYVKGFAVAAGQTGDAPSPATGLLYLDAVDFSWDSSYVPGRNRIPGNYLPQEPTPEVTITTGEEGAALQWMPLDVSVSNGRYEILLNGSLAKNGLWASGSLITLSVGGLSAGDYIVELVLDDGYGGVATSTVILHVNEKFDVGSLLLEIDELIALIEHSADGAWAGPATQRKHAMIEKLNEVKALLLAGNLTEAYDKLLHDIKPKLTGLKVDENGNLWGSGTFKNPWVVDPTLQETFTMNSDSILRAIRSLAGGDPDPVGRLLGISIAEIHVMQGDIASNDCGLARFILKRLVGTVETNLENAWDLFGADHPDWAAIRVKVADCLLGISDVVVSIGDYLGAIDPQTAESLGNHISAVRANLSEVLALLGGMA